MTAALDQQLAALAAPPPDRLRAEWVLVTARPLPRISPALLRLALAWEIQAQALGGLSRATCRELDQRARGTTRTLAARGW